MVKSTFVLASGLAIIAATKAQETSYPLDPSEDVSVCPDGFDADKLDLVLVKDETGELGGDLTCQYVKDNDGRDAFLADFTTCDDVDSDFESYLALSTLCCDGGVGLCTDEKDTDTVSVCPDGFDADKLDLVIFKNETLGGDLTCQHVKVFDGKNGILQDFTACDDVEPNSELESSLALSAQCCNDGVGLCTDEKDTDTDTTPTAPANTLSLVLGASIAVAFSLCINFM